MKGLEFNRGKVLLDASKYRRIAANRRREAALLLVAGLTFLVAAIVIFFLEILSEAPNYPPIIVRPVGVLELVFLLFMTYVCFYFVLRRGYLKVYENGILLPVKRLFRGYKLKEEFIPYEEIEAIYPNMTGDIRYVAIQLKMPRHTRDKCIRTIDKHDDIFDLHEFMKTIRGRAKVIEDQNYEVGT